MSTLWHQDVTQAWQSRVIPDEGALEGPDAEKRLRFVRFQAGSAGAEVALLAPPGVEVHVNGAAVLGGLRVLEHQDEILAAGARLYYSSETAPIKVLFHWLEATKPPSCPVCRRKLEEGQEAIQCPRCSRWLHEMSDRQCWTYFPNCPICKHPTALTGEPVWRPENEEGHD